MENKSVNTKTQGPGRPRLIERDHLLDIAEQIILTKGAAALTIDALAKAAGVTKGGVQYTVGTKETLIHTLFERWHEGYEQKITELGSRASTQNEKIDAHIELTLKREDEYTAKAAAFMSALMRVPEHLAPTKEWYRSKVEGLDLTTPEGRIARLKFLATEGVFILRYFGFMDISDQEWQSIFDDIKKITTQSL